MVFSINSFIASWIALGVSSGKFSLSDSSLVTCKLHTPVLNSTTIPVIRRKKKSGLHILPQGLLALLAVVSLGLLAAEPSVVRYVTLDVPPMATADPSSPSGINRDFPLEDFQGG